MSLQTPKDRARFRARRVRGKILGTGDRPRLAVYRSSRHIYAQIVDDSQGKTLAAASSLAKEGQEPAGLTVGKARRVGAQIAQKALAAKIDKVVFDRGAWPYHGRIKALADAAREGGLKF